ncbi:MAG: hypothetical protein OQK25_02385 [Gammaproteobacteria bacterium]|nr:hypothetical protein [Gammaproteobacteria bacterium]
MYEYVFFDEGIRDHFTGDLKLRGVEHQLLDKDGLLIGVSEDISDEDSDAIDDLYDRLLQQNGELMEQGEDALELNVAGVQIQLADGSPCTIRLDTELVSRLMSVISMEELRDLCQSISEGVELRDNSPLCHILD